MTDIRQRITSDENWFDRLSRNIPGFGGYKERENRRTADQILRKQFAEELERQAKKLDGLKLRLTDQGELESLGEVDRLSRKLNRCIDLIRFADYGYTGFFDAIKIQESDLDRLYEYDAAVANRLGEVGGALDQLMHATGEAIASQLTTVTELLANFEGQWQNREQVMKGLAEEEVPCESK